MKDLKKKKNTVQKGPYTDVASCARRDSYGTHYISLLFFSFFQNMFRHVFHLEKAENKIQVQARAATKELSLAKQSDAGSKSCHN
jgi:hypothetical protein